ncbi:MAG: cyclic nucleotide-binding domain-containing protein [Lachnospiraceae bacterium]|nr:cyclic nucleotide-binding domain-containing protein [Lachnospiraceae bacterium]
MDDFYIRYLEKIINVHFSEKECEIINTSSKIVEYNKGAIPIRQGDILTRVFVIVKGLVRGFYIDVDGSEITKCFSCEKSFFSREGLISLGTASFPIECLENVLCIEIPYSVFFTEYKL